MNNAVRTTRIDWRVILGVLPLTLYILFLCSSRLTTSVTTGNPEPLDDLPTFVAAASAVQVGQNPYDVSNIRRNLPDSSAKAYPYVYTPVFAQILSLIPLPSYWRLQDIWTVVSAILLSFWLVYTVKVSDLVVQLGSISRQKQFSVDDPMVSRHWQIQLFFGASLLLPLSYLVVNGQLEPLLLPLLTLVVVLELRSRQTSAGALLGVLLIVKHAALFMVIWLLIRRSWKTLIGMTLTTSCMIVLSIVFFGVEPWQQFVVSVMRHTSTTVQDMGIPLHSGYNLSVIGLATRLGLEQSVVMTFTCLTLFVSVCILLLWYRSRRTASRPMEEMMILALTSFLVLPYFWTYHLMYVATSTIFLCAQHILRRNIRTPFTVAAIVATTLAFVIAPGTIFWKVFTRIGIFIPMDVAGTITTLLLVLSITLFLRDLSIDTSSDTSSNKHTQLV